MEFQCGFRFTNAVSEDELKVGVAAEFGYTSVAPEHELIIGDSMQIRIHMGRIRGRVSVSSFIGNMDSQF